MPLEPVNEHSPDLVAVPIPVAPGDREHEEGPVSLRRGRLASRVGRCCWVPDEGRDQSLPSHREAGDRLLAGGPTLGSLRRPQTASTSEARPRIFRGTWEPDHPKSTKRTWEPDHPKSTKRTHPPKWQAPDHLNRIRTAVAILHRWG